ncbi:MAG: sugar transferase [Gammaproteobacteria bacterium]|nr:sugar transferase [Gammaproteobacteria bacterium]
MNRLTNLVMATIGLALLSPLLLLIFVGVLASIGSPALFVQERPGLNGRIFRLYKFRTMRNSTDERGEPLDDSDRLTKLGTWLRRTSLDELPELWNVIRGDMNLVGPRPLLPEYLPLYTAFQKRRHEVRPGLTGWAQVNGRNSLDWEQKFALDVWYVDNRSFWLDMRILLLTAVAIFRTHEVSEEGHPTARKFRGSR